MQAEPIGEKQGAIRRWLDDIPLGLAPLLIACMGIIAGLFLLVHPVSRRQADLVMWTFGVSHSDAYKEAAERFSTATGRTVDLQLVNYNAVNQKLRSALWAAVNIPDLVEIEKSAAGGFFRGPIDKVGFLDLKPYMQRDGIIDRIPEDACLQGQSGAGRNQGGRSRGTANGGARSAKNDRRPCLPPGVGILSKRRIFAI